MVYILHANRGLTSSGHWMLIAEFFSHSALLTITNLSVIKIILLPTQVQSKLIAHKRLTLML